MSLSGQYLEELSRRYKKQVEEMQRSLERAVTAMSEESRKGEERDAKRVEEISALREEIVVLSKSVETLLYDRDSWRSRISAIVQHALLICLEVIVIILILSYCRRREDFEEEKFESDTRKDTVRRKSAENFSSHAAAKKTKKRRPSEIASHISGTYHELMIDDRPYETKKERKKKRKKEINAASAKAIVNTDTKQDTVRYKNVWNVIPGNITLPSRKTSSIEPLHSKESQDVPGKRPESTSEATVGWFDDQIERIERIKQPAQEDKAYEMESGASFELDRQVDELSKPNTSLMIVDRPVERSDSCLNTVERKIQPSRNGSFRVGILKGAKLSSPSFMKTALGTRNKRKVSTNSTDKWEWSQDSEHSNDRSSQSSPTDFKTVSQIISDRANGSAANGLIEESDESRSSSATPTSIKKEKRGTGLKKMVRKFF